MPLLLSEADVRSVLGMPDLIDAMQSVLAEFSTGATQQPLRTVLQIGEAKSFFGVMPGYVPTLDAMGTKLVTVFESNPARGLPSHLATIVLLDPSTGALRAIVDGRYITEARTGAVSAVAARLLARETPASSRRSDSASRREATCRPSPTFGHCARSASGVRTRPEGNRSSTPRRRRHRAESSLRHPHATPWKVQTSWRSSPRRGSP